MTPPPRRPIQTPRLVLRPTEPADAETAFRIQSNWNVTRMLRLARFPPDAQDLADWFLGHAAEWARGEAYRFAIQRDGRMIGVTDIDEISGRVGDLGYWLDEPHWGQDLAREAGEAMVRFGFEVAGLHRFRSGHVADNLASGRVLTALGFRHIGDGTVHSRPRGTDINQRWYRLDRPS
jgi:[ribosomal protein S5]-alanine N-acetyltransferase